jgi:hypothetical protein
MRDIKIKNKDLIKKLKDKITPPKEIKKKKKPLNKIFKY